MKKGKKYWDLSVGGDWQNEYEDVTFKLLPGGGVQFNESDGTTHFIGPATPYWIIQREGNPNADAEGFD